MTTVTLSPPNPALLAQNPRWTKEARWRSVAQEVARDIFELRDILSAHGLTDDDWREMERTPGFSAMLLEEIAQWRSSLNTRERIELRTLAMVEMSLVEMYRALHDPAFGHAPKVELFKTLARNVGIGVKENGASSPLGERVNIVINMGKDELGEDRKVEVRDVTPKVIEGTMGSAEVQFELDGGYNGHTDQRDLFGDASGA